MQVRLPTSALEVTTCLMVCSWSLRRRNPRNKNLILQHLYLRLSQSRRNPKKWMSSYYPMMRRRRTPLKRMSQSLP